MTRTIYEKLFTHFGPQNWWPADTPFEMMVGGILTQNTNWKNVEKGILKLKESELLDPYKINRIGLQELADKIRSTGYHQVKSKRLKELTSYLIREYQGNIEKMEKVSTPLLRQQLLAVSGIGPETADSILLYALNRPVFVVDQYTYRLLSRHFLVGEETSYDEMQELITRSIPEETLLYQEYHALIVKVGKEFCRKSPKCEQCPLNGLNW